MKVEEILKDYVNDNTEIIVSSVPVKLGTGAGVQVILKRKNEIGHLNLYIPLNDLIEKEN